MMHNAVEYILLGLGVGGWMGVLWLVARSARHEERIKVLEHDLNLAWRRLVQQNDQSEVK